jgi:glycosyl transferase family 25
MSRPEAGGLQVKCYVINLASSPERLAHMRHVLGGIGVAFERFDAINLERSKQHPALGDIPPLRVRRPWAPGELACLLSHYEVWKLIAEADEPFGAVFEDDLHVDPRLAAVITDPAVLPTDADIVKLETVRQSVWVSRLEKPGPAGVTFAELETLHEGAGAYILSRQTAALLVRSIAGFDLPADDVLFGHEDTVCSRLRRYQVLPALAVQDIILSPEQRSPLLDSTLEPDRLLAWKTWDPLPETVGPRSLPARALRRAVREYRRLWRLRLQRQLIVPFAAGGKTVAG